MNSGYVLLKTVVLLLIGVAGAGKTCFSKLLLNKPPPDVRESTPLAQASVRAVSVSKPRPVALSRATVSQQDEEIIWEEVKPHAFNCLVANLIKSLRSYGQQLKLPAVSTVSEQLPSSEEEVATHGDGEQYDHSSETAPGDAGVASTVTATDVGKSHPEPKSVQELFKMQPVKELLELIPTSEGSQEIFQQTWLHLIDSGGQPQFHDLLPTFVHHVSAAAFFIKLNEKLKDHPVIEYYSRGGVPAGKPYKSPLNHLQTVQNCLQAMQSRYLVTNARDCPELFFVGTHHDLENEDETLKSKNDQLSHMLWQHDVYSKHLTFYRSSDDQLLYPVNAISPTIADKDMVSDFRRAVMERSCICLLYTSPSPRDATLSRMPSSA